MLGPVTGRVELQDAFARFAGDASLGMDTEALGDLDGDGGGDFALGLGAADLDLDLELGLPRGDEGRGGA